MGKFTFDGICKTTPGVLIVGKPKQKWGAIFRGNSVALAGEYFSSTLRGGSDSFFGKPIGGARPKCIKLHRVENESRPKACKYKWDTELSHLSQRNHNFHVCKVLYLSARIRSFEWRRWRGLLIVSSFFSKPNRKYPYSRATHWRTVVCKNVPIPISEYKL